jgi:indole-3-acetate monooxygenase
MFVYYAGFREDSMTSAHTSVSLDPLAGARALAPRIGARASEIEAGGRLPADLVEEMRVAGLFHLVLPRDLGGVECDPATAGRVVEEVAAADGSAGWCVMIAAQNQGFAGFFEKREIEEIWGHGGIMAGVARPIGRAIPVMEPARGYRVSGRWPFASGSSHADWFGGECLVYDGAEPRRDAAGNDISLMVAVPRESVTVYNTWDTVGLRGTASNDFSFEDVFVPEGRAIALFQGPPIQPWPAYRAFPLLVMNHGSQALGVARAAIASFAEIARTKAGWGGVPLHSIPRMQALLAEATVLRESAACYLYAATEELWTAVNADVPESQTALLRSRVRLAAAHAAQASVRAVDLVHGAAGTTALFRKSPLERQFRDMHAAAAHVMIGSMVYEAAGRVELGNAAEYPFF